MGEGDTISIAKIGTGRRCNIHSSGASASTTPETGGNQTGDETPKQGNPLPIVVNVDTGKETPVPKKRGRKPGQKNVKKQAEILQANDISVLLQTGFSLTASRLGAHWQVGPEEADSVAQPLSRILNRLGAGESVSKYSDYIVLFIALSVILIPRVLVQKSLKKKVVDNRGVVDQKGENRQSSAGDNVQAPAINDSGLKAILPSLAG